MIKYLERVVALLDALPENYQKEAADSLAWFLKRVDNEMTMTKEEIEELRRLETAKRDQVWRRLRELLGERKRDEGCVMQKGVDTEGFGEQVAQLMRKGSREQYDEVQRFVADALRSGDRISGDMIMEVIWSLLPKTARKKIVAAGPR